MIRVANQIASRHNVKNILNFRSNVTITARLGLRQKLQEVNGNETDELVFEIYALGKGSECVLMKIDKVHHGCDHRSPNGRGPGSTDAVLQRCEVVALVKAGNVWMDLSSYLAINFTSGFDALETLDRHRALVGDRGYDTQFRWWQSNGRAFRLLDLPGELRTTIYKHYIGDDAFPHVVSSSPTDQLQIQHRRVSMQISKVHLEHHRALSLYGPDPRDSPSANARGERFRGPDGALLAVCRQVGKEVSHVLWNDTRKCFIWWAAEMDRFFEYIFLPNSPAADPFLALKHIHLALCMVSFCELFEVVCLFENSPEDYLDDGDYEKCSTTVFETLPLLRCLELEFASPVIEAIVEQDNVFKAWQCQVPIVDTILAYAFRTIKKIPNVKLCGAIKNRTKAKWDRIFLDEKNGISHKEEIDREIERWESVGIDDPWNDE